MDVKFVTIGHNGFVPEAMQKELVAAANGKRITKLWASQCINCEGGNVSTVVISLEDVTVDAPPSGVRVLSADTVDVTDLETTLGALTNKPLDLLVLQRGITIAVVVVW